MKNTMIEKCISLCLVCMMLLSVLPSAFFASAEQTDYPTMEHHYGGCRRLYAHRCAFHGCGSAGH